MKRRELTGAYARGLYHACGLDDVEGRPVVGIANSWSEVVPGHVHLDRVARAAAEGVLVAGGSVGTGVLVRGGGGFVGVDSGAFSLSESTEAIRVISG